MTKKEKTKLIVWSCIGVAVLAAILLLLIALGGAGLWM